MDGISKYSTVVLGIRPEDIAIGVGPYQAKISLIEPLGRDYIIHLDVNGKILRALVPANVELREGETINFDIKYEKIHLFDKKSGELIV